MPATDLRREVDGPLDRWVTTDFGEQALLAAFDCNGRRGEESEEQKTCSDEQGDDSGHVGGSACLIGCCLGWVWVGSSEMEETTGR